MITNESPYISFLKELQAAIIKGQVRIGTPKIFYFSKIMSRQNFIGEIKKHSY